MSYIVKKNIKKKKRLQYKSEMKRLILLTTFLLATLVIVAQENNYCRGLKNPTSFVIAGGTNFAEAQWYGFEGSKYAQESQCGNWGMYNWGSQIPASQLESRTSTVSCTNGNSLNIHGQQDYSYRFAIKGPGYDPHTSNRLSYLPPDSSYTSSIRLGNNCGGHEAEMLCYQFKVRPQNSLIFIWYALSLQNGLHSVSQNPEFAIEIERKVGTNTWQRIGGDTLCYIRPTPATGTTNYAPFYIGSTGLQTGGSYGCNIYLPWNKVAINLNNYLYETIRIKIGAGDCSMTEHYSCAYIAGECQAMEIKSSGCPAGATTVVDTLRAPSGLSNYVWYKCNSGMEGIGSLMEVPENINFTRLTPLTSTNNTYLCNIEDFLLTEGSNAGNFTDVQVFRCDMTSAMNPDYPFVSKVYVSVQNTKPQVFIDTLKTCDGDLTLINKSYVPNNMTGCDTARSRWTIWDRQGQHSYTGGTVRHRFDTIGTYNVNVRSFFRDDTTCYSESTYPVHVLGRPTTRMEVSSNEVCDSEMVVLRDVTQGSVRRDWIIHDSINDTIFGRRTNNDNLELRRIFENYKNPVELRAYNGLFCRDSVNTYDTIWCTASTFDTIEVFQHPELIVTGDTVVCNGQETDITVATETEGCTYKWYLHIDDDNQIANGQTLRVMPYDDTCKYYVKVISAKQCVAWDSVNAYRVNPKLSISRHDMCAGDEVTLTADAAYSYSWSSSPTDSTLLNQLEPDGHGPSILTVKPKETTVYTLVGHGTNDCNANPLTERINVHQIPIATVKYNPAFVDSDNPVVTFTDDSPYSVRRVWYFDEGVGQEITSPCSHNFGEVSSDSVNVTLVAYNDLECSDTLVFRLPVTQFTFYAPNVFNPERPDNNTFSIFTANEQEMFSVFIYDRNGRLVYTSEDLHFKWDGTTADGIKCPQGTYAWVIRYRRPSTEDIVTQKGTVTLLR